MESHTTSAQLKERSQCQRLGWMGSIIKVPRGFSSHVYGTLTQDALKGWLDLQQYYISAFKSGVYPSVLRDRIFLWGRLYPANADAPRDRIGKPSGWQHVRPSAIFSLRFANMSPFTDRRFSLGYGLFNWRERLRNAEVWRIFGSD